MDTEMKPVTGAAIQSSKTDVSLQDEALMKGLSNIIESVPDAVITAGPDSKIVYFNNASLRIFGYSGEEMTDMPLRNILPEQYCSPSPEADKYAGESFDAIGSRKNGPEFPVQLLISGWRSDDKAYRTYFIRDLTEQKRKEEDHIRSKGKITQELERLSQLFLLVESIKRELERTIDCVGDLIVLNDDKGKIRRCNRTFKELVKMPYEEILGKDWGDLLFGQSLAAGRFGSQGTELFHAPSSRWFVIRAYPFRNLQTREISGEVISIHDSTELRAMTRELERKNEELEQAYIDLKTAQARILQQEKMASIGQLAAGVAHEINNPIGFISSNLGTLDKYVGKITEFMDMQSAALSSADAPRALTDALREKKRQLKLDYIISDIGQLIKESLDGTERVKKIVQDLKSFSRTDEEEYKSADINAGLESTINIVWNEIKYKAALTKQFGDIPMTQCNAGQLNQVFMNILVNAAHAIERQGEIIVKTWDDSANIYVSITDNGSGIAEDKLGRIFEPFFTTKEKGKGTGLGLSIAYEIMKKHNGDISVDSTIGRGTTFTLRIPIVV